MKLAVQAGKFENQSSHERILDAAELEFSRGGFAGSGMKSIAQSAGVAQGLLHYHFGNKENLYEAVVERRSKMISAAREALLSAVDVTAPNALEMTFDALFRPPLEKEGGGEAYGIIFTSLLVGSPTSTDLVRKYYDSTAKLFIAGIMQAEPRATAKTAALAYSLAIGMLVTTIGSKGRIERLAGLEPTENSIDDMIRPCIKNAVGGLTELIKDQT